VVDKKLNGIVVQQEKTMCYLPVKAKRKSRLIAMEVVENFALTH